MNQTKRRSRFHRDEKPFELTDRDREILEAIFRYRYITARGLIARFGRPRAIYRRLTALYHGGYVQRLFLFERPQGYGSPEAIYVIDKPGAREVTGGQFERHRTKIERRAKIGRHHLKHALGLSEFQLCLDLAAEQQEGVAVERFIADREDKKMVFAVSVPRYRVSRKGPERKGGTERLTLWPDAEFTIASETGRSYYFLESDFADRKPERLFKRFLAYWQYTVRDRAQLFHDRGVNGALVLFITSGERQQETLIKIAEQVPEIRRNRPGFWFLNREDLSFEHPARLIAQPIVKGLDGHPGFLTKPPKSA